MRNPVITLLLSAIILMGSIGVGAAHATVSEQPATDKLVELLKNSQSHRVRLQAAYSLGGFPSPKSQKALLDALKDPYESVRAAALGSLAKVGKPSTLSVLRRQIEEITQFPIWSDIAANRSLIIDQLYRTIALLEEKYPDARPPLNWDVVFGALTLGSIQDSSSPLSANSEEQFARYFLRHLNVQRSLVVVSEGEQAANLAKYHIKNFVVIGQLASPKKSNARGQITWSVEINFALRERLAPIPVVEWRERATISRPESVYRPEQDNVMRGIATEAAFRMAAETIAQRMRVFFEPVNDLNIAE